MPKNTKVFTPMSCAPEVLLKQAPPKILSLQSEATSAAPNLKGEGGFPFGDTTCTKFKIPEINQYLPPTASKTEIDSGITAQNGIKQSLSSSIDAVSYKATTTVVGDEGKQAPIGFESLSQPGK